MKELHLTDKQKDNIKIWLAVGAVGVATFVLAYDAGGKRTALKIKEAVAKGIPANAADTLADAITTEGYFEVIRDFSKSFCERGFDYNEVVKKTTDIIDWSYNMFG